jgi:tetratricopeptide (TPR) repeat protein
MDYDRLRELQEKFEENPRRYFAPLANEYRKGGQPKRAIEICRSQLTQMPGHMSGQIVYAQSLYECGEFEEARTVFERALALDPENLIALRSLGDMSLQSGDTVEARKWYQRLLDADPKDPAVVALVTEIDAAAEAAPVPTPQEIPGVDEDAGDQAIPLIADVGGVHPDAEPPSPEPSTPEAHAPSQPAEAAVPSEPALEPDRIEATAPASPPSAASEQTPPVGLEGNYPIDPIAAGLPDEGIGAEGLRGGRQDELMGAEGLLGTEPELPPEPVGAEGLSGKAPAQALAGTTSTRSDDEDALETWTPPPAVNVDERAASGKEDRMFSGPGPEPFVNETMAQLYLQQGYRQLALKVYYQLAESRPDDQVLKDRIAEIEAADRAAHPPEPAVQAQSAPSPDAPRAGTPPPQPPRHRESADTRAREEPAYEQPRAPAYDQPRAPAYDEPRASAYEAPRAQPEGIAARQPSVREFFATLGRRRPPRSGASSGGSARPANNVTTDTGAPMGGAAPSASLDAVFAGATVSPADSRAASRLAGAFSGAAGTSRTSPPTPPMPTPRVNPRLPQTQESEEDVAKFRAWLDGLTGE